MIVNHMTLTLHCSTLSETEFLGSLHLTVTNIDHKSPLHFRTLSERKVLDEEGVALDVVLPLLGALDYLHREVGGVTPVVDGGSI